MNKEVINFKTDAALKKKARQKADELGISLSAVLNAYLRKFLRVDDIDFIEKDLEPSLYLKRSISQAEAEKERGEVTKFDNFEDEMAYLDSVIRDAEKRQSKKY